MVLAGNPRITPWHGRSPAATMAARLFVGACAAGVDDHRLVVAEMEGMHPGRRIPSLTDLVRAVAIGACRPER